MDNYKRSHWNIKTKKSRFSYDLLLCIFGPAVQFLVEDFTSKVVYPSLIDLKWKDISILGKLLSQHYKSTI